MLRKLVVALSIAGLLGFTGLVSADQLGDTYAPTCIDCWEMKIR